MSEEGAGHRPRRTGPPPRTTPRRAGAPRPLPRTGVTVRARPPADRVEPRRARRSARAEPSKPAAAAATAVRPAARVPRAGTRPPTTCRTPSPRTRSVRRSRSRTARTAGSRSPRRFWPVLRARRLRERERVPTHRHAARQSEHGDEEPQRPARERGDHTETHRHDDADMPQRADPRPTTSDHRPVPMRVPTANTCAAAITSAASRSERPCSSWRKTTPKPMIAICA